jgi:hypothetical protein
VRRRLIGVTAAVLAIAAASPGLADETDPPVCTLIGCISGVGLGVAVLGDRVDRVTFCVRDRCKRIDPKRGRPSGTLVKVVCDSEITVLGVLTTRDEDGRKLDRYKALIPMKKVQPNGPQCPPTCFQGSVRFNGAQLVVQS